VNRDARQRIAFGFVVVVSIYAAVTSHQTQTDINRIEPQVTRVVRATAACKASILDDAEHLAVCARRIEVGLGACAHSEDCRAAFLALMRSATRKGVVPGGSQNPSGLAPGQGSPSGPETQPSPSAPSTESTPPQGLDSVVDGVEEVTGDVEHVVEEVCTYTRELLHLC
jgi:hypothetical protein